jgi:transposase-like protein
MAQKQQNQQAKRERRHYGAEEKVRAVLSLWSEKRTTTQVCREHDIKWTVLKEWQNRALEGMMQALEPRVQLQSGPALSPRLSTLLNKRMLATAQKAVGPKLEQRLEKLQEQQDQPPQPKKKSK